jgi:hypothetical protein
VVKRNKVSLDEWEVSDLPGAVATVNWSAVGAKVYRRDRCLTSRSTARWSATPCTTVVRGPGDGGPNLPGGRLPKNPARYPAWAAEQHRFSGRSH